MCADVINPSELVNKFVKKLPTGNCYRSPKFGLCRYGEVFIDQHRAVVLRCSLCDVEYRVYQEFLEHIFAHLYIKAKKSIKDLVQQRVQEMKKDTADSVLEEQQISEDSLVNSDYMLVEELAVNEDFQFTEETIKDIPQEEQNVSDAESNLPKPRRKLRTRQEMLQRRQHKPNTRNLNHSQSNVEKTRENSVDSTATESPHTRCTLSPTTAESSDSNKLAVHRKNLPKLKKQKSNNDEQTFTCNSCGCTFKNISNLRAHAMRHTGQKPFECDHCQMKFYTRTELTIHDKRRHSKHRPFVCAYCGLGCVSKSILSLHERKHSANLPHVCSVCGKAFIHAFRLKNHMPVHTRERKYVCAVCNTSFTHRKVLGVHMKLHLNAREYTCDLCGMSFNQKPTMLLHKKSKHKVIISNRATANAM